MTARGGYRRHPGPSLPGLACLGTTDLALRKAMGSCATPTVRSVLGVATAPSRPCANSSIRLPRPRLSAHSELSCQLGHLPVEGPLLNLAGIVRSKQLNARSIHSLFVRGP
jgi:hypothetical protein